MVLLANVKRKKVEHVVLHVHHDWFSGSTSNVQKMVYFQGVRKQSAHHICLKYEVELLVWGSKDMQFKSLELCI
jgi:hypothetical protein